MFGFNNAVVRFTVAINGHTVDMEICASSMSALRDVCNYLSDADIFEEVM